MTARIDNPVVAGFLLAEAAVAQQSGIVVQVDRRSRLRELPRRLSELDAITLIGNLVHNAVEAVADMPPTRRRVSVRISQSGSETTIVVRDWGPGLDPSLEARVFDSYTTTKDGHSGIGLALVRTIVTRAGGRIDLEQPASGGLSVTVAIPA